MVIRYICSFLVLGVACSLQQGPTRVNKEQLLFTLDHGRVTLGSRSAKRRFMNASNSASLELSRLAVEHKTIIKRISLIKKPGHYGDEQELKQLKRRKLLIKDMTNLLRARVQTDEDESQEHIGAGGFADVVLGHQVLNDGLEHPVAVKVSRSAKDAYMLLQEAQFLQELDPYPGFVKVQHVETLENGAVALVLNLLGPSLEDLWWACTCGVGGFSAFTVLQLAIDLISRLDSQQKVGIAHRDIQPANILMGDARVTHLIDFGIAERINEPSGKHQDAVPHAFSGTPQFASVNALFQHGGGNRASDDLESLCYTLAFLRCGTTPWEGCIGNTREDALALADIKAATCANELCGNDLTDDPAAIVIGELLTHARSRTKPDYSECQKLIKCTITKMKHQDFDWIEQGVTWSAEEGIMLPQLVD